jgi:hypothetical protein
LSVALLVLVTAQPRLCWAEETAPASADEPISVTGESTPGNQLLAEVVRSLNGRASIAAKLRLEVNLLGVRVIGKGRYFQQGRGPDQTTRLELRMNSHSQNKINSLLVIKDEVGDYLWRERRTPDRNEVSKVNLRLVRRAWLRAEREAGRPASFDSSLFTISIAGLPRLVSELNKNFRFDQVHEKKVATRSGNVAVFEVIGRWGRERLAAMLPAQSEAILSGHAADLTKLPEHLPHEVMLWIDRDTWFPHVFEYRRYQSDADPTDGDSQTFERLAWLQLYDVEINRPIDPRQFIFKPGPNAEIIDVTERYLPHDNLRRPSGPG